MGPLGWLRCGMGACVLSIVQLSVVPASAAGTVSHPAQLHVFPAVTPGVYQVVVMGPTGHFAGVIAPPNTFGHVLLYRDGTASDLTPSLMTSPYGPMVFGINSSDQIVYGLITFFDGPPAYNVSDAHVLTNGVDSSLDAYNFTGPRAINDHGHILGYRANDPYPIFSLLADGTLTDLVGVNETFALNDADQVLSQSPPGIWSAGAIVSLPFTPIAFNNLGHVVGRGVLWRDGKSTDIDPTFTPVAINDLDQIVGTVGTESQMRAVLWDNGTLIDLNTLIDPNQHFTLAAVKQIDDFGDIFGEGYDNGAGIGADHQYLLNLASCIDVDQDGSTDNDGDGLCDNWETEGIDFNHDGVIDLTLDHADMNHKDVYVEVDWMAQHQPLAGALAQVVQSFAQSPVQNPDGHPGVALHVQVDEQAVEHEDVLSVQVDTESNTDFDRVKQAYFGTAAERASNNAKAILAAKRLAYRYALFVHNQFGDSASGVAEVGGNDIVISLGSFSKVHGHNRGNLKEQAGTFMHELGHSLGLRHGGGDDLNCKPNLLSVMSYTRQFDGDPILGRKLDYSNVELPTLNEAHLDETLGIQGPAGDFTVYVPTPPPGGSPFELVADSNGPIDYNDNGAATDHDVAVDITGPCSGDSSLDVLFGHDDWSSLAYSFRDSSDFMDGVHAQLPSAELTYETALTFSPDSDSDGVTNLQDNCITIANADQADGDEDGVGDACDDCPTIFNPSQAPCASLPPGGEPDDPGTPVAPSGGGSAGTSSSGGAGGDVNAGAANGGSSGSMSSGDSDAGETSGVDGGAAGERDARGGSGGASSSHSSAGSAGVSQSTGGASSVSSAGAVEPGKGAEAGGCSCAIERHRTSPIGSSLLAFIALAVLRRKRRR